MTRSIHVHLLLASAATALAGCSAALSQEAAPQLPPNTAIVVQSGPELVSSLEATPPEALMSEEVPPPLNVPPSTAEAAAPEQVMPKNSEPPRAQAPAARARATCEIIVDRTSHGVRVTPVFNAASAMNGDYRLVITKSGPSGSSDISQGGPLDARRGDRLSLSASEFSLERGATFRAVLTLSDGGREICRKVRT